MSTWIVLLRGINVGGSNKIAMADLRASLTDAGFDDVATYIQSGNLLFDSELAEPGVVETTRRALVDRHGLDVPVVARTRAEVEGVADRHPDAAGDIDPKLLHVAFLDREPGASVIDEIGVDTWAPDRWSLDGRELFLTYPDGSARSKMTIDRFEQPWAVTATARNLNTVRKLVELARSR